MLRATGIVVGLTVALVGHAEATEYISLDLYGRVQGSDTIVLARIIDPAQARLAVERVLKGNPPPQITLVNYIDPQIVPDQRKELVLNGRELMFLTKRGDAYAPIQNQYGRLTVTGNRLVDSFKAEPRDLSSTLESIERLISHQARAARGDAEADAAYVSALKNPDVELHLWALWTAKDRLSKPSPALVDAVLARWPKQIGPVYGSWNAAGLIANVFSTWRVERTAPFFARILTTSTSGEERAWAATALGGAGDRQYASVLRKATEDEHPEARSLAYDGLVHLLGPEALRDLRRGAKDPSERVRAAITGYVFETLELGYPKPRWPPASDSLIAEARALLTEMQSDPVRIVSDSARHILVMITNTPRR